MNEFWETNHGEMPKGITAKTRLDIEYRDGRVMRNVEECDDPDYWIILNDAQDIIRWRFS